MKRLAHFLILFLLILSSTFGQSASISLSYSTAAARANSNILQWSSAPAPCAPSAVCYRVPLDPNVITAGSTLVMMFGYDSTGGNQVFSVTDDKSNTYNLDVTSSTVNSKTVKMYRATNIIGGVSYINIQLTSGSLNASWQPIIAEFYNADALDASSCSTGSSATISAGNLTPTVSGDLIFQAKYSASLSSQTASFTAGSQANISWSLASELLGDGAATQYGVYNSTATLNPTFAQAGSDSYISCAVALKAHSTGTAPTGLRVRRQEHDAMPKSAANPWIIGMVNDTPGTAVYFSYMGNDPITSLTAIPTPTVGPTASGADFVGLNGHNHTNIYCMQYATAPGQFTLSLTRGSGGFNDSINMMYEVIGGTCNLDVDSGGSAGNQGSFVTPLTMCSNCITPTLQNDFILGNVGQAFRTVTGVSSPSGGVLDSAWFSGNNVDGSTQTDENNGWFHYFNGGSLSPITVSWVETYCCTAEANWAGRVAAYQSVSTGAPQPPTGLKATVN